MTTVLQSGDSSTTLMRWIARILGLLASALFVWFLVCAGIGLCKTLSWSSPRGIPLLIVMAIAAVGVLLAWRWEMFGGTIATTSALFLGILVYFGSGHAVFTTALLVGLPFFVAGILFLVCCWRTRTVTALHRA